MSSSGSESSDTPLPRHVQRTVEDFQSFFAAPANNFANEQELVSATLQGGAAEEFARFCLAMRLRKKNRHTFGAYRRAAAAEGAQSKWWGPFVSSMWLMYSTIFRPHPIHTLLWSDCWVPTCFISNLLSISIRTPR